MDSKKKRKLDQLQEKSHIEKFVQHCNAKKRTMALIECPIKSIKQRQLSNRQNIPDGIVLDADGSKKWIEVTTFSRHQEMHQFIGELAKKPEKFKDQTFIPGPFFSLQKTLVEEFANAVCCKTQKDYTAFAKVANVYLRGILLVVFVTADPFFDREEWKELLHCTRNEHLLRSWGVGTGCFNEIIFGAWVNIGFEWGGWCWLFETIADAQVIQRINQQVQTKNTLLAEHCHRLNK